MVLGEKAINAIQKGYAFLHKKINEAGAVFYGINTGFGSLCDTVVSPNDLDQLQMNLIRSHACGLGAEVPVQLIRRMLLLKAIALAKGYSGVQLVTVERLLFLFNNHITPVVYEQGSLGASGDLAPLAHLCLPLIGEGEVQFQGERISGGEMLQRFQLSPIRLQAKEGLALLNGTQFMNAYGIYMASAGEKLFHEGLAIAALSLEAFDGRQEPFNAKVHDLRHQTGQILVAEKMRKLLLPSQRLKKHVQDPYSFRCIPQVHGASWDTMEYAKRINENELNAITDNPTLFPEDNTIISAGNFHGQPLALILDFMAIAMAEMGSISERRIYKLISGSRGLPPFLVANPGLNSGLMIAQYTCASIVSQNKQLCTPASIDTIDSSNGQEDHVSMGANAATKLARVIENCFAIQGIELLNAAQALDFRRPLKSSQKIENLHASFRNEVSFLAADRNTSLDMKAALNFVKNSL